jgi:hypothetical protein
VENQKRTTAPLAQEHTSPTTSRKMTSTGREPGQAPVLRRGRWQRRQVMRGRSGQGGVWGLTPVIHGELHGPHRKGRSSSQR